MPSTTTANSQSRQISKSKDEAIASPTTMSGPTLGGPVATVDDPITRTTPLPPRLSDMESRFYYSGLPSNPILVARTGSTPWEKPTGPEEYPRKKQLGIVGSHGICEIWQVLAPEVCDLLNKGQVDWTSIDPVRIGHGDEHLGPVVLWIGIKPDSQVSYKVNYDTAVQCKELLIGHDIKDVEVEMRKSEIIRLAGPRLFQPVDDINPTAKVRRPFTPTLGTPICAQPTPWAEGTAGFFLNEGGEGKRLLLITARHVVLPTSDNTTYECNSESQRRHDIVIFSDSSFKQHLAFIRDEIDGQSVIIESQVDRIKRLAGRTDDEAIEAQQNAVNVMETAKKTEKALTDFYHELSTQWDTDDRRVLGHLIFSPPIAVGVGTGQYTRDIAVIAVDPDKIDPASFTGNAIDLGFKFSSLKLTKMMYPDPRNPKIFKYPGDRLLWLHGIITEEEMRRPNMYDGNGQPCIMVLKLGKTTDLTVGRANNIFSYTRSYFGDNNFGVSREWAILPFDNKSGAFSDPGDSGSVVVDGAGRIGGLLTGGSGITDATDVTYVTPISFILETIRSNKSLAKAHFKSGQSA